VPPADLLEAAAAGRLPAWARAGRLRMEHMSRVADLLGSWADALCLPAADRVRWRAAGYLHDSLRDAPVEELRALVPEPFGGLSGRLLHGPAAAARLREDGVDDESLLLTITWHTTGHPDLDRLGRCLYVADFIEPGRRHEPARLAGMRERMPTDEDSVLRDVLQLRIAHLLREQRPLRAETAAFWNAVNARAAVSGSHGAGGD
jgi:HD superfamily phosphohydrolase YqeK